MYCWSIDTAAIKTDSIYVIVLEKRSNFAVKLIFQYEPLKLVTLVDFVHNPECLN